MPAPTVADEFIDLLTRSRLLTEEQVNRAVNKFALRDQPTTTLAKMLVDENLLSPFQAKRLLQGKWRCLVIDKYRIVEPLGAGGMGWVYIAEEIATGWKVAIKVLSEKCRNLEGMLARFRLEAQAGMRLAHPNILRTLEINAADDTFGQIHYVVMELVQGINLQELLSVQKSIPWKQACDFIAQAANGLHFAHEAGLVHRDVKPENLLIRGNGQLKLLDFGLAKLDERDEEFSMAMIHGQDKLGTADYIAPEQIQDSYSVDRRADIYSLGCTLYFALAGHVPFPVESTKAKLHCHLQRRPQQITKLRSEVPEEVEKILRKMTSKRPEHRYATAAEVAQVLEPFAERLPVEFNFQALLAARARLARAKAERSSQIRDQAGDSVVQVVGSESRLEAESSVDTAIRADTHVVQPLPVKEPLVPVDLPSVPVPPLTARQAWDTLAQQVATLRDEISARHAAEEVALSRLVAEVSSQQDRSARAAELERTYREAVAALQQQAARIVSLTAQSETLTGELTTRHAEAEATRLRLADELRQRDALQDQLSQSEAARQAAEAESRNTASAVAELQARLAASEAEAAGLRDQTDDAARQHAATAASLTATQSDLSALREELSNTQARETEQTATVALLAQEIQRQATEAETLRTELSAAQAQQLTLQLSTQTEAESLQVELRNLQSLASSTRSELDHERATAERLHVLASGLEAKLGEAETARGSLEQSLGQATQHAADLEQSLALLRVELAARQSQADDAEQRVQVLESQREQDQAARAAAEQQVANLSAQAAGLEAELSRERASRESEQARLNQATQHAADLEQSIAALHVELAARQAQADDASRRVQIVESQLDHEQAARAAAEHQATTVAAQFAGLEAELSRERASRESEQTQLAAVAATSEQLARQVETLTPALAEQSRLSDESRQRAETAESQLAALRSAHARLDDMVQRLSRELESTASELAGLHRVEDNARHRIGELGLQLIQEQAAKQQADERARRAADEVETLRARVQSLSTDLALWHPEADTTSFVALPAEVASARDARAEVENVWRDQLRRQEHETATLHSQVVSLQTAAAATTARLEQESTTRRAAEEELANAQYVRGAWLAESGRPADAIAAYRRAVEFFERLVQEQPSLPSLENYRRVLIRCHNNLANLFQQAQRDADAHGQYAQAIAFMQLLREQAAPETAQLVEWAFILNNFSNLLRKENDLPEAARWNTEAIRILEALSAADLAVATGLASSHINQGAILVEQRNRASDPAERDRLRDAACAAAERANQTLGQLASQVVGLPAQLGRLGMPFCNLGILGLNLEDVALATRWADTILQLSATPDKAKLFPAKCHEIAAWLFTKCLALGPPSPELAHQFANKAALLLQRALANGYNLQQLRQSKAEYAALQSYQPDFYRRVFE